MATQDFYIDTVAGEFVTGPNSSQIVQASSIKWNFGDTPSLRIFLLTKVASASIPNGFDISTVPTNGIPLELYLEDGLANSPTVYTSQTTWGTDTNNTYFFADLALNTAGLLAIMTSDQGGTCWLKIGYRQNGKPTTILSKKIPIGVGIPSAALVVPPGQTALSAETAAVTFVPQAPVAGIPIYLMSTAGKIIGIRAFDNPDGTASLQPFAVN